MMELMDVIKKRKSFRSFKDDGIRIEEVDLLCEGVKKRSAPSAGGLYPVVSYLVMGSDGGFNGGFYKTDGVYLIPGGHGDYREQLFLSSGKQQAIKRAPISFVLCINPENICRKYGISRGMRYAYLEAGHIAQNISLIATSLGLGSVCIGAFRDSKIKEILNIEEDPVYIIPIGRVSYG